MRWFAWAAVSIAVVGCSSSDEPSSPSGGGGSSGASCNTSAPSMASAACQSYLKANCCAELAACESDPNCKKCYPYGTAMTVQQAGSICTGYCDNDLKCKADGTPEQQSAKRMGDLLSCSATSNDCAVKAF